MGKFFFTMTAKPWMGNVPWVTIGEIFPSLILFRWDITFPGWKGKFYQNFKKKRTQQYIFEKITMTWKLLYWKNILISKVFDESLQVFEIRIRFSTVFSAAHFQLAEPRSWQSFVVTTVTTMNLTKILQILSFFITSFSTILKVSKISKIVFLSISIALH